MLKNQNLLNFWKTKMQSNIYTSKMHSHKNRENPSNHSKLETSEKGVKTAYKGKTWKRGTDKRNVNFDGLQGA